MTPPDLRWSRYLRTREQWPWTAVFHELHPDPWYVPTPTWQAIRRSPVAMPPLARVELAERGLLVAPGEDDAALAAAEAELTARLDTASILYLVLVQGCNFTCQYCPIPELGRQTGNAMMSPDTAVAAVEMWARHLADAPGGGDCCVILYGGEPLLARDAMTAAISHVERLQDDGRLPRDLMLMLCTNGVLMDRETAHYLRDHRVTVAVGCDGPEEFHDAIRRDVHGNGTYTQVEAAIRLLVAEGVETHVSAAITPHNLAALDSYSGFFAGLGVAKFGFNFLRGRLLFRLLDPARLDDYHKQAVNAVVRNYDRAADKRFEYQAARRRAALLERHYFPTDCNGYGNQLVVEPGGEVGNCPFIRGTAGNVHDADPTWRIHHDLKARAWRARLPLWNPACAGCDARAICGAGCAWNAAELKGDPLAVDDAMCLLTRRMFDRLIWHGLDVMSEEERGRAGI